MKTNLDILRTIASILSVFANLPMARAKSAIMPATTQPVSDPARRCVLGSRRCIFRVKAGAFYGQERTCLGLTTEIGSLASSHARTKGCSSPPVLSQADSPISDHARSDPARQVHLGIKTGAFYGQEACELVGYG